MRMRTKTYNQTKKDSLLFSVSQLIDKKELKQAVITAVFTKNNNDKWSYLIGKCEFSDGDEDIEETYSDAVFVRKYISDFDLEQFLISLYGVGYLISDNYPPLAKSDENEITWAEEIVPSHGTTTKYPERKYSANISKHTTFTDGILLGYDSGFRTSAREYVKEFMGLDIYNGQSHGGNGEFSISIPDQRGRIALDEGKVSIDSRLENVCLVGDIPNIGCINLTKEETVEVSKTSLNDSELWLLTNENKILDFRSAIEWQDRVPITNEDEEKSQRVLAIIERGEGHETEFKPYIDLTDSKNGKASDIEKTVCAFSNGKGGYLLIGVEDDGCIKGVDDKAKIHYKLQINKALETYTKDINKRLLERLRYNQCYDI